MNTRDYLHTFLDWLSRYAPVFVGEVPPGVVVPKQHFIVIPMTRTFASTVPQPVMLYDLGTTSQDAIVAITDAIRADVGVHGLCLRNEAGVIRVELGTPFYQPGRQPDKFAKSGLINLDITTY